jgi:iron complex outermembrane receptor protein
MIEIGIKKELLKNQIYSSLALYQINVNNLAVNANDASNPDLFVQSGEQQSRGLEAEMQGNLNRNLSFNINYSFNQTEIIKSIKLEEIGTIAANAPKHSSSSWIKYDFFKGSLSRWGISIGHYQVGKRNTLDPSIILPGYFVLNGGIHYEFKHIRIAVNFNNLLIKTYWAAAYNNLQKWPGAPRNVMFRVFYNF